MEHHQNGSAAAMQTQQGQQPQSFGGQQHPSTVTAAAAAAAAAVDLTVLSCSGCNQPFAEPCLLDCFHTLCARCVRAKVDLAKRSALCPMCG